MSTGWPAGDDLERRIAVYAPTAEHNDALFRDLTRRAGEVPWLAAHRSWIEEHRWGFGDRAFHAMWLLIARDLRQRFARTRALEIGVFKGQVISLWALLSRELDWPVEITAVSPFRGRRGPDRLWLHRLRKLTSPAYRRDDSEGNLVPDDDHLARCAEVFAAFGLDFGGVRAIRGLSGSPEVRERLAGEELELVYVDGDHSYEGARGDLETYGPAVVPGGYLVVDDAAWGLPGSAFFKGFEPVARACRVLPALGFQNVLNVGHNRIFRKLPPGEAHPEVP